MHSAIRPKLLQYGASALLLVMSSCSAPPNVGPPKQLNVPSAIGKDTAASSGDANTGLTALAKYNYCTSIGKAWLPEVDPKQLASNPGGHCGANLATFCCTQAKLQSLYIGAADELQSHFQALTDKKFQIYECSQESADEVKVHLIKVENSTVVYTSLSLTDLLPSDGSAVAVCPQFDMNALLQPFMPVAQNPGGTPPPQLTPAPAGTPAPSNAPAATPAVALSFDAVVNPVLTNNCGGASCHGSGASNPIFVGSESAFKADSAQVIARLQAGTMPPSGQTLSPADKATLLTFLASTTKAPAATPAPAPPKTGLNLVLVGKQSARCVDAGNGITNDGVNTMIYDCTAANPRQSWSLTTAKELRLGETSRCLDTAGGSTNDATAVVVSACSGAATQKWDVQGTSTVYGTIKLAGTNQCLDVSGEAVDNASGLIIYPCNGQDNEAWQAKGK